MWSDTKKVVIIGHRGAAGLAPENTMKAFRLAHEMGADMVELDVQETSDRQIVCVHDYSLERLCGVDVLVNELAFDELKEYDIGEGETIPLLSEVLGFAKNKMAVNIEIKVPDIEEMLFDEIKNHRMLDEVLVSSFFHETLSRIRSIDERLPIGVLFNELPEDPIRYVNELGGSAVNPLFYTIDEIFVKEAHEAGLKVYPWTVNDPEHMLDLLKMGVDGIITDLVDLGVSVVEEFMKNG